MSENNIGKRAAALRLSNNPHLSTADLAKVMLALREDFDWVSTVGNIFLLNKEVNSPEQTMVLLSNIKILRTTLDSPLIQQLYRRVLERAAYDLVQHIRADVEFIKTPVGEKFWQGLVSRATGAYQDGLFSGADCKPYLASITDSIAEAANLLKDEGMLSLAGTIRCFDDMRLSSAFVLERRQWRPETVA